MPEPERVETELALVESQLRAVTVEASPSLAGYGYYSHATGPGCCTSSGQRRVGSAVNTLAGTSRSNAPLTGYVVPVD